MVSRLIFPMVFISILLLGYGDEAVSGSDDERIVNCVHELDMRAHSELGIGLGALSVLIYASKGTLDLYDALESRGKMKYVDELKSGLVTVKRVNSAEGLFIEILPSEKGEIIKRAVMQPR